MRRAGQDAEKPGCKGRIKGDVAGVLAQEAGRSLYHIVQPSGGLEGRGSRNDSDNNEHYVDGNVPRLHPEDEYQQENTHHAIHAQADGAHTRSDKNHRQDNGQFKKEECGFHNISYKCIKSC